MRTRRTLTDGWHVKALETDQPDIASLTREATSPDDTWLPALMPAQVHDVLLAHGRISDPHVGKNAADSAWVGDRDWAYACAFAGPGPADGPVFLHFGGLDTLCAAFLNGEAIGTFDNMFREYAVDVGKHLNPPGQTNLLLLIFSSPLRFVRDVVQHPDHVGRVARQNYLRKAVNDFNSYLGARPHSVKVGVYRPIALDMPDRAWLEDVWVRPELSADRTQATVRARITLGGSTAGGGDLVVAWAIFGTDGREIGRGTGDTSGEEIVIPLERPQLWWPWTHGTPALYRLRVQLTDTSGTLDEREAEVGIRDVRLVLDDAGTGEKRFQFEINGRPLFLQGANWVPVEGMTHCWIPERARRLLDLAQRGHMNLLRVWAGGHMPPAEFYRECDRRGILVWQDFMFEGGMHPVADPAYAANCRLEVEDVLRRLRNHPCLLLWAGGNENYMWWDFDRGGAPAVGRELFEELIPAACARLDPTRPYHPNSPYGGRTPNWPLEGDWHDYTWRGFSHESAVPLFISEGGRASAASVSSLRRFLSDEDLWPAGYDPAVRAPGQPAWPPLWQYRSVEGSWIKVAAIEEFCDPRSAAEMVRVLGTAHGEYLQRTVERYRRGAPDGAPDAGRRCGGYMVWRLGDAWPINYYSVVDYYLEPKIAFYFLRRAYAPVLVCFERTDERLAVWVVNDSAVPAAGPLTVRRMGFDGTVRGELTTEVAVAPGQSRRCLETVDLGPVLLHGEFLQARFASLEASSLLLGERHLHLPRADVRARRVDGGIEIAADVFARQVALEVEGVTGAVFEDNFFDLAPGGRRTVAVVDPAGGGRVRVQAQNGDPVWVPWGPPGAS